MIHNFVNVNLSESTGWLSLRKQDAIAKLLIKNGAQINTLVHGRSPKCYNMWLKWENMKLWNY